ncbi:MAG: aspartate kinase [Flavobacteriaceae bacterium]|jgi:aspartate kinase
MKKDMIILKIGGSGLTSSADVKSAIARIREIQPYIIVVSALKGITNLLSELALSMTESNLRKIAKLVDAIKVQHVSLCKELGIPSDEIILIFENAIVSSQTYIDERHVYATLVSAGELMSSKILYLYMKKNNINYDTGVAYSFVDIRDYMITSIGTKEHSLDKKQTFKNIKDLQNCNFPFITQGFISSDIEGHPTTLGREGSDFSAVILAVVFQNKNVSSKVIFLKDVDGVIIGGNVVKGMSYSELRKVVQGQENAALIHLPAIKMAEKHETPLILCNINNRFYCSNSTKITKRP